MFVCPKNLSPNLGKDRIRIRLMTESFLEDLVKLDPVENKKAKINHINSQTAQILSLPGLNFQPENSLSLTSVLAND
jgi:hypothetical protein